MPLPTLLPGTRMAIGSLTVMVLGIGIGTIAGCGSQADQPQLAPTPPGVELLKPDPNPPKKDPLGS